MVGPGCLKIVRFEITDVSLKYCHRHKEPRDKVLSLKCYCFGDDTSSEADLYQFPNINQFSKSYILNINRISVSTLKHGMYQLQITILLAAENNFKGTAMEPLGRP